MRQLKKAAKFTAVAVAFGVIASTAYQGSNYLYSKTEAGAEQYVGQRERRGHQRSGNRPGGHALPGGHHQ